METYMLNDRQIEDIESRSKAYPRKRSALLEALSIAQGEKGYIDGVDARQVADLLSLSIAEVHGAATFYHMIRNGPGGKHSVALCTNVSCTLRGAKEISLLIQERLGVSPGEVTEDGRFSFEEAQCLGCCDGAPCMMVDDELHGNLTREEVERILEDSAGKAGDI
jgi:NADH-quinone oxidoreductase subunit E